MNTNRWEVERPDPKGPVYINIYDFRAGSEFDILLGSDPHTESVHCDRAALKRALGTALENNMPSIWAGDIFDVTNSRNDKRRSGDGLIPELRDKPYIDGVNDYVSGVYSPYAAIMAVIADGNHDTYVSKNIETDLVETLCNRLRDKGSPVQHCGYFTWVIIRVYFTKTRWTTRRLAVYHGFGGSSPVTKGVIDTARIGVYLPDADVTLMGHTHTAYVVPVQRMRINAVGRTYEDKCLHIRTPGFKNHWLHAGGWAVEKGIAPSPRGYAVLTLSCKPGMQEAAEIAMDARLVV